MAAARIAKVVAEARRPVAPASLEWLGGGDCQGSKFHSPAPLLVRPIALSDAVTVLVLEQPGSSDEEVVRLCATCTDNLTVYLSVLAAYAGQTPQAVRRDFGNTIRSLGDRAWALHQQDAPAPV